MGNGPAGFGPARSPGAIGEGVGTKARLKVRERRMAEMMTTDVRALLDRNPFDASAVADLREVLGRDPSRYRTLRDAVARCATGRRAR